MKRNGYLAVIMALLLGMGCGDSNAELERPLFELVSASESGVDFANLIDEDLEINMVSFEYLFNGGGVSVGDVDGDSLPDLFMTATQGANRLYRNLGGFRFEDRTETAGVAGRDSSMTTGTTMADVDGDGDLDIYVCQTGKPEWSFDRRNLLYINQGDGTFLEQAASFGLDSRGYSNHATFFDYDKDGDLDLYLINHPPDFGQANVIHEVRRAPERFISDQLFRNEGDRFVEVTEQAGVANYAFGLSATVNDYNDDGWPDVFVANDYVLPDFLYVNNGDGTFTERGLEAFPHTAASGMGSDAADINNDGLIDFVVADMMAEDARRQRVLASAMMYDRYQIIKQYGYGDQVQRNMLQINNGDGTFSDVGYFAGVATTDWSWSPLLADFDLDGHRDLFIANGYRREVTNLDYVQFTLDSLRRAGGGTVRVRDINEYLDLVPSEQLKNYAFRNEGGLEFTDVSEAWGLGDATHSNGAAYGDLDGDGDLDLIVNDVDGAVRLYRNRSEVLYPDRHWLKVRFNGPPGNPDGIGARVQVQVNDSLELVGENVMTRGFLSSVEPVVYFGLGGAQSVRGLVVRWSDGQEQRLQNIAADQTLTVSYDGASNPTGEEQPIDERGLRFSPVTDIGLGFVHEEDPFVDFKRDILLQHMHSREGPALHVADWTGDGLDDVFVGGAAGQVAQLYVQTQDGQFISQDGPWGRDALHEDVRAFSLDANDDGHLDLYVASGGSHFASGSEAEAAAYQDRIYMGDGSGGFEKNTDALPPLPFPTGAVASGDLDGDGDLDLFVGGRLVPGRYPEAPRSAILLNENGQFRDVTAEWAPELSSRGLVTAAVIADFDGDGRNDLALAGEWMPVSVWRGNNGGLSLQNSESESLLGWWNTLAAIDTDDDGDLDLIGGNLGLNSRIRGSQDQPVRVRAKDFDQNGVLDPVFSLYYRDGREYPIHRRESLMKQLPYLQQRFPRYGRFAASSVDEVFTPSELAGALVREANWFATTHFENDGGGRFTTQALPTEVQLAPIYAVIARDLNQDGVTDLIFAGNSRAVDVERGPYDALRGVVLLGDGAGGWNSIPGRTSGLSLPGDVRAMDWLQTPDGVILLAANNDGQLQAYRLTYPRAEGE